MFAWYFDHDAFLQDYFKQINTNLFSRIFCVILRVKRVSVLLSVLAVLMSVVSVYQKQKSGIVPSLVCSLKDTAKGIDLKLTL